MLSSRRRWRTVPGVVALLLIAGSLALRTERAGEAVCAQLRQKLPAATGMGVSIGRCAIDPLTASVEISRLSVTAPPATEPLLTAERAAVSLRGVFLGGVSLQDLELIRPHLVLTLPAASDSPKSATCPIDELRRLRVSQLRVVDGSVVVHHPSGTSVRVDGLQVDAALDRREATVTLDARGGSVAVSGRTLRIGRTSIEGLLDLESAQVELQRVELSVEGATIDASGTIDSLCEVPVLDLTAQAWLPLDALPRLGVPVPAPSGQLLARVTVGGRADGPTVRGEVQGSRVVLGPFTPGDFSMRAAWSGKRISLEEFSTRAGEGELKVTGELSLEQGLPLTARVDVKEASLARVLERASVKGAWVDFPATVKGVISGNLLPTPSLSGDIDFKAGKFLLASRAYDAPPQSGRDILAFAGAAGRFRLGITPQAVSFNDVAIRVGPQDRTRVSGDVKLLISGAPGIELAVSADAINLADFGSISGLPWSGEGQARITINGPFSGILVDGQTTLRDFKLMGYSLGVVQSPVRYQGNTLSFPAVVAQKGQTQYFGDVALAFLPEALRVQATAQLPDGRVEDVVDLLADLSPTMQNLQDGALIGRLSALVAVDCPVSELEGVIAARVHDVRYLGRRLGEAELVARFEKGEALVLDPTVFDGPLGRTGAEGRWAFAGPLDFHVALEHGSLAELADPEGGVAIGGEFTSKVKVGGTTDEMTVNAWIASSSVAWKSHALGPMHLEANIVGRELDAKGVLFPGLLAKLSMSMRNDWPFSAQLGVSLHDLTPFLPESAAEVAIKVKGDVDLKGPMRALDRLVARAVLSEFSLSRGEVSASNVDPVRLGWNAGAIEVDALQLKGPTTELTAAGAWGPTTVDLKTRGSIDLRLLSSLVTSVERTQGMLEFTAAFSGVVNKPALAGTASLVDGRFAVRGQDVEVRALSGRADFSESIVFLDDVQGFMNDGRLRARGKATLDKFALKGFKLEVDVEDVTVQVQPEVPVTVSGPLVLDREGDRYLLNGKLDVEKFRYVQPMALESLLASAKEKPSSSDAKPEEWLRLNVDLSASGDVRIENNLARAKLGGNLKVAGTNVKPVLVGVIETQEGAQAYFRGNTFNVQRGQLQFNGLWPTFDLSAQSQIREYLVSVKAFGRFEDPKVSLSSEPPLPDTDILSLVTLGVTSRERLTETSGAGLAAEALLSASGLDKQVQRFLQQNVGLKDQQVKITTSYNEASGTAEPAVSWESKVISDNLNVGVVQSVTGRTRAQAEYKFNQRVSARAQWDNQTQNTTVGNPGVELRFRFEWE